VSTRIVFETHSTTEDNERGIATGWLPGELSAVGLEQARELGDRRCNDGIDVVFTSDLRRAVHTTTIAVVPSSLPVLIDWRLRECDYGDRNGAPASEIHGNRLEHLDDPYPGGESWRQAVARVGRFLDDLPLRWDACRVLVIGHSATKWALDHLLTGFPLDELIASEFQWRPGWEYEA
jgi:broad specificity phosphatase PhoE